LGDSSSGDVIEFPICVDRKDPRTRIELNPGLIGHKANSWYGYLKMMGFIEMTVIRNMWVRTNKVELEFRRFLKGEVVPLYEIRHYYQIPWLENQSEFELYPVVESFDDEYEFIV
jgi:hypothetical protein